MQMSLTISQSKKRSQLRCLIVSDKKIFYVFASISLCDYMCLQWWGHVWPQRHKLNKFSRSALDDSTYHDLVISGKTI